MKTRVLIIIGIALTFTFFPYSQSHSQLMNSVNDFNFGKQGCELIIFDQWQPTVEGKEWAKNILDECVKREFITQELADMAPSLRGYGTASITAAYRYANADIWKTIKILQDPNFPNNMRDPDFVIKETPTEISPIDETQLCGGGAVIVDGICQVSTTTGTGSIIGNKGFMTFLIIVGVLIPVSIGLVVVYWRKRK